MTAAYQWNAVIPLVLLSVPPLIMVALIAARHRRDRVARPLLWLALALLVWVIGYAFELAAVDRDTVWGWLRVQYVAIVTTAPLWLLIVLRYLDLDRRLGRWLAVVLAAPPALAYLALLTNEQHHLFYRVVDVELFERGPLFWAHAALAYGYLLVALALAMRRALDSRAPQRHPAILLAAAAVIPFAGNAIHLFIRPLGTFDPTPSLLTLGCLVIAYALTRGRLLQARPVALRTALAAAPDAILVANTSGWVIEANPTATHLFGITPRMPLDTALARADATPAEREQITSAGSRTILLRSERRIVEARTAPVIEHGQAAGLIVILRDVTERERLVEQLATARAELEARVAARTAELTTARAEAAELAAELAAALAAIPEGIVVADAAGHHRLVNAAANRLLRGPLDPARTLTEHLLALMPHDSAGLPLADGVDPLGVGEIVLDSDSPAACPLAIANAPIETSDGVRTGSVTIFRDLSDARRLERARREFLAMVAHELRSPVTTISMGAQLLERFMERAGQENPLVALQREPVAAIFRQAQRLTLLVSDLLEGARIESSALSLAPVPFDLGDLARRLVREAAPLFTEHRIELQIAAPAPVLADPTRVEQIVLNLLDNARKYSPPGRSIELTVTADEQARLIVRDYGPGIPAEDLPHLFDRFYRSSSVTRGTIGLGLGLALSRELAHRMQGDITVISAPEQGSTFTLTLPLINGVAPTDQRSNQADAPSHSH